MYPNGGYFGAAVQQPPRSLTDGGWLDVRAPKWASPERQTNFDSGGGYVVSIGDETAALHSLAKHAPATQVPCWIAEFHLAACFRPVHSRLENRPTCGSLLLSNLDTNVSKDDTSNNNTSWEMLSKTNRQRNRVLTWF